jgi:hypothetical protein
MSAAERSAEVAAKLALLRDCLERTGAAAICLRGTDWFAWVTAGGSNAVLQTAELGVAEVLVTREEAVILTDEIEAARLREEEVPPGFTFHVTPWAQVELRERYVLGLAGERPVLSDRPHNGEQPLPTSLRQRRLVLGEAEQARYRLRPGRRRRGGAVAARHSPGAGAGSGRTAAAPVPPSDAVA